MAEQFQYLFTPLQIGSVTVRNRIFNPAHGTMFAENNLPTERHAYYLAEKAKGGVGLIISEITSVHPTSQPMSEVIFGFDDRAVPRFKMISDMVHEHGAKIFGQLWHCGRQGASFHSRLPVWAPSAVPSPKIREMPHAMTVAEIKEVIAGFGKTAANFKAGGYDGVEIHGAHGYLINQFMSPATNLREDEYGGSLENRLRFAVEVIDEVRRQVGNDFVVGMRISGDEMMPGGLTLEDMKVIAQKLEATGKLDYLSVSVGTYNSHYLMIGDMNVPLGAAVYLAAGIKEVVSLPVFTVLRINDPVQAEKILADGQADMVGMCRALICDPELPNKAREGRLDDIRKCVACDQECRSHFAERAISCVQNPAVGFEKSMGIGTLKMAAQAKKVVVVGGGPAGMEAARVLAMRGHRVTIFEKKDTLGGQINIAAKVPNRAEFGDIARFLERQVEKLGVEVRLRVEVDSQVIFQENPDAVVIASGSVPRETDIPGAATGKVQILNIWQVLEEGIDPGQKVVIYDDGHYGQSFWQACSTAEFLAGKGKEVIIVTNVLYVGMSIPAESLPTFYQRFLSKGGSFIPNCQVKAIEDQDVLIANVYSGKEERLSDIDSLVLSLGNRSQDALYYALQGKVPEVYMAGDCVAPRKVADAIREGHIVGRQI